MTASKNLTPRPDDAPVITAKSAMICPPISACKDFCTAHRTCLSRGLGNAAVPYAGGLDIAPIPILRTGINPEPAAQ